MSLSPTARAPVLSVVLIVRHPQETPDSVLAALASETAGLAEPFQWEVILADGRPTAGALPDTVPDPLLRLLRPGLNMPLLKAEGLARARGQHVAFLEPKAVPVTGWLRAALAALDAHPGAALGGAVTLAPGGAADRAAYAFEYLAFAPARVSQAPPADLPGNNMILPAEALRHHCKDILSSEGLNKPFCQARLKDNGVPVVMIPDMAVQIRTRYNLRSLLASRYRYARCFGGTRAALAAKGKRWTYRLGAPIVPALLLYRHLGASFRAQSVERLGLSGAAALSALCLAWSAGEATGSWFGTGTSCDSLY
ncbi:hypothetical protein [Aliiroseovarius sp.]|uniref:hypothetical protein n=1 Tax=Aliiroseovarius sp. TaxID=1872442 RepID=UPI0026043FC3|nr:hypothetical protein [Aliiroseovarius sp.]